MTLLLLLLLFAGAISERRAVFGAAGANTQIFLDNVHCLGIEEKILDCEANPIGTNDCNHLEDAGVRCQLRMSK